jgi:tetrapyrrole methylase family protein/MazG family protein
MVEGFTFKKIYEFGDLIKIVSVLRAPGGCPWDREQTHKSIRADFIEETYEAIEAIDTDDSSLLEEELGDVLLQVAMHSEMEKEAGRFDIKDVIDGVCKKLIVRHPHVFGDVEANTTSEVLKNWDEIKKRTKGQKTDTDAVKSVSRALPSLMRSAKVQKRASRAGYDFSDASSAEEKLREELGELETAIKSGCKENCKEEIGDLLFAAVNVSRLLEIEPEGALTESCDKFTDRFALCEKFASEEKKELRCLSETELDELWNKAKTVLQSKAE